MKIEDIDTISAQLFQACLKLGSENIWFVHAGSAWIDFGLGILDLTNFFYRLAQRSKRTAKVRPLSFQWALRVKASCFPPI